MDFKLPFIDVEGTNYNIGFEIGKKTKRQIKKLLKMNEKRFPEITGLTFDDLILKSRNFLHNSMKKYPSYVEELIGISDGAKTDFDKLFLLTCEEEIVSQEKKCTSISAITSDGNILIAHNEDWDKRYKENLYLVKAKQPNLPDFLSLSYVGSLPGSSAGFNDKGIGFTGNSLPFRRFKYGVPKNVILRSILDSKNFNEATKLVKHQDRSISTNSILVDRDHRMIDIESSLQAFDSIKTNRKFLVHTNHIVGQNLRHLQIEADKESERRYNYATKTLEENENNISVDLLKNILKDHNSGICSHPTKRNKSTTIASVIIDINNKKLFLANGNPCKTEYQEYQISF